MGLLKNTITVEKETFEKDVYKGMTKSLEDAVKYARPLIIGELQPHFAGGVPVHITLE